MPAVSFALCTDVLSAADVSAESSAYTGRIPLKNPQYKNKVKENFKNLINGAVFPAITCLQYDSALFPDQAFLLYNIPYMTLLPVLHPLEFLPR